MEDVVKVINSGGVAVVPTDTVYGVVASAFNVAAIERIYELKERDHHKPFIILLSEASQMTEFKIQREWVEQASEFWPGPTSVIVPCEQKKYHYLHRGTRSLAFRVPDDSLVQELLVHTGPLVAPSANPQGLPPAETLEDAEDYFGTSVDTYLDGGIRNGPISRLVRLTSDGTETLRG